MSSDPDQFDLPPKFADALRETYAHRSDVPANRERFILSAGRARFAAKRRPRRIVQWSAGLAAAVAATFAITTWIHHPAPPKQPIARGDLNADGAVNMIDALVLARHLAANDPSDASWDLNRDGAIDQKDIDTLATTVVNLKQPRLSQNALPKLRDLGINPSRVGFASANGFASINAPADTTFAKANPTPSLPTEEPCQ